MRYLARSSCLLILLLSLGLSVPRFLTGDWVWPISFAVRQVSPSPDAFDSQAMLPDRVGAFSRANKRLLFPKQGGRVSYSDGAGVVSLEVSYSDSNASALTQLHGLVSASRADLIPEAGATTGAIETRVTLTGERIVYTFWRGLFYRLLYVHANWTITLRADNPGRLIAFARAYRF